MIEKGDDLRKLEDVIRYRNPWLEKELGDVPRKVKQFVDPIWGCVFSLSFCAGKTLQKPRCLWEGKRWLDVWRDLGFLWMAAVVYIAFFQRPHHLNFVVVFAKRDTAIRLNGQDFLQSCFILIILFYIYSPPLQVLITFLLPPRWAPPPAQKNISPTFGIPEFHHLSTLKPNSFSQLRELHPSWRNWRVLATAAGIALTHPDGFTRTPREPTLTQCAQPRATRGGVWSDGWMMALVEWVYGFERGGIPKWLNDF